MTDTAVFHGIPHIPGSRSFSDDSMKKRQNSEKARQRGTHPDQQHDKSPKTEAREPKTQDTHENSTGQQPENIVSGDGSPAHNSKIVMNILENQNPDGSGEDTSK